MIIMQMIDSVGHAVIASSVDHDCCISVKSPSHLSAFMTERFNPKKHQAALLVKFKEARFCCFLESPHDVPLFDVRCPSTGLYLIKYEEFETPENRRCVRID